MLQSIGLERVGHNLATQQQQQSLGSERWHQISAITYDNCLILSDISVPIFSPRSVLIPISVLLQGLYVVKQAASLDGSW